MPSFYLHPSNRDAMDRILALRDGDGNPLLSSTQRDILLTIARFDKGSGNFMSLSSIQEELGRMTVRTLKRHLKYLHFIGVIEEAFEERASRGRSKVVTIRRIRNPEPGPRLTLTEFRVKIGMTEYNYAKDRLPVGDDIFFDPLTKFAHESDQFCPEPGANFAASIRERIGMENKKEKEETPPKAPSEENKSSASRTTMDGLGGRPLSDGVRHRERDSQNSSEEKGGLPGEPLVKKRKKGKVKSRREKIAEANQARAKGHLVPPLGKKDTRGRTLRPAQARDIGESGSVTIPQLWKAYCRIFEDAFGIEDLLPSIVADSRENVTRHFDEMKQRMLDVSGYEPTYRDLYEYLKWFHDPKRLKSLLAAGSKTGHRGYVHPKQLSGKVHLRRFYDQVLIKKAKGDEASERVASQRERTHFVQDAYDHIRRAQGNDLEMAYCIVNYGYVIFAEWLRDYNGFDGSACKKRIVEVFRSYIEGSDDPEAALDFLSDAWKNTAANAPLFASDVWDDWEGTCSDIMAVIRDEQQ